MHYINIYTHPDRPELAGAIYDSRWSAVMEAAEATFPSKGIVDLQYVKTIRWYEDSATVEYLYELIQKDQDRLYREGKLGYELTEVDKIVKISDRAIEACRAFNAPMEAKIIKMEEFRRAHYAK